MASRRGESFEKNLKLSEAITTRDTFAKALYDRLFTAVVMKINKGLAVVGADSKNKVIGVLDIYGFEILPTNSFEQLCINYCTQREPLNSTPMAVNSISFGSPRVRPIGVHRTCGEPNEIKKSAHP